jgi:hypothetical protein
VVGEVGDHEIYLEGTYAPQKCHGDSGGPTLVDLDPRAEHDWRLIGVASRAGESCTGGSIESRVDAYLGWVHSAAQIPCGSGESPACPSPPLPGAELGALCTEAADCADRLCIAWEGADICSSSCELDSGGCGAGFDCVPLEGRTDGVCVEAAAVPPLGTVGEPCERPGECVSGVCAGLSAEGPGVCSRECAADSDCPESFTCTPDGERSLCLPPAGGCSASPGARAQREMSGLEWSLLLFAVMLVLVGRTRSPGGRTGGAARRYTR